MIVMATSSELHETVLASSQNFLLPNGTFFFELILFVIVFALFARFIVPPIRRALEQRAERIRQAQREKEEADEQYAAAERRHDETLADARRSASEIRDEARASGRGTAEELRGQAESEVASVRERGDQELADQRTRVRQELHGQLPELATGLAERILGRSLSGEHRGTVDEYVSSIDAGSGGGDGSRRSSSDGQDTAKPAAAGSGSRAGAEDG
jgi:F-type H+-transporting ATPase subunit b